MAKKKEILEEEVIEPVVETGVCSNCGGSGLRCSVCGKS